jgi:hypothetical protein
MVVSNPGQGLPSTRSSVRKPSRMCSWTSKVNRNRPWASLEPDRIPTSGHLGRARTEAPANGRPDGSRTTTGKSVESSDFFAAGFSGAAGACATIFEGGGSEGGS